MLSKAVANLFPRYCKNTSFPKSNSREIKICPSYTRSDKKAKMLPEIFNYFRFSRLPYKERNIDCFCMFHTVSMLFLFFTNPLILLPFSQCGNYLNRRIGIFSPSYTRRFKMAKMLPENYKNVVFLYFYFRTQSIIVSILLHMFQIVLNCFRLCIFVSMCFTMYFFIFGSCIIK